MISYFQHKISPLFIYVHDTSDFTDRCYINYGHIIQEEEGIPESESRF